MKKRIIAIVAVVVVVGGLVSLRIAARNKSMYTSVKTTVVGKGDIKSYLSTTATLKSKNIKNYYGPVAKVGSVAVKVGDSVKKGQVLVTYDVQDLNSQVKQAQIQYNNAVLSKQMLVGNNNDIQSKISDLNSKISDLNNQINQLANSSKGNPTGIDPTSQLKQQLASYQSQKDALKPISDEQFKQADNQIQLAKLTLDSANQNASKNVSNIVADFDGTVTSVNVEQGAMGNSAQPAVVVQDLNNLEAVVEVGKYDADKVKVGEEAVVKNGDKEYKGKVAYIDPAAKTVNSPTGADTNLEVDVDILDKPEGLKVNFDTDIDILLGQVNDTITIPAETIRTDKNGKNYVYVVQGEKAVEKTVQLGLQSDMDAQVIDGIKAGDKVILNPSATISNGTLVKDTVRSGK